MKNRNEQPSAKQNVNHNMQSCSNQQMKNKAENNMESCNKNRDMKNNANSARTEMRTENSGMKNRDMKQANMRFDSREQ